MLHLFHLRATKNVVNKSEPVCALQNSCEPKFCTHDTIGLNQDTDLERLALLGDERVDGDEDDHDGDSGQNGRTERHPEEVERHAHLEGRRPDHVEIGGQFSEALRVHRHEVHNLPDRRRAPRRVAQPQGLKRGKQSLVFRCSSNAHPKSVIKFDAVSQNTTASLRAPLSRTAPSCRQRR